MGDAGEGLVDAESRLAERMEEREEEKRKARQAGKGTRSRTRPPDRVAEAGAHRNAAPARDRDASGAQAAADAGARRDREADKAASRRDRGPLSRSDQTPLQSIRTVARYLDWATQPDPFRRYDGAPRHAHFAAMFRSRPTFHTARCTTATLAPHPIEQQSIGEFLRCSMGLSAWKQYRTIPMGASREPVEWKPASDRGLDRPRWPRVPLRAAGARA